MKKIKRFLKNNLDDVIIVFVSFIAFIAGCISIGWLKAIIIVAIADILFYVPVFLKYRKRIRISKHKDSRDANIKSKKIHKVSKNKKKKFLKILVIIFMVCCILGIIGALGFFGYVATNAPKFNEDNLYQKESTILYDSNGEEITKLGLEKREAVTYDELPEVLVNAIIATEDSRFFQHSGVDWSRFLVASLKQLTGVNAGGASTITMQISKNAFTSKEDQGIQGIIRKFTDIYVSTNEIEPNYSKEEIIELYVNSYYLGRGAYGVEQACQTYFGKSVSDINLAEAAMIAGLFKGGYAYDPTQHPVRAEARREIVLSLMKRHGYITEEERQIAADMDITDLILSASDTSDNKYLGFVETVVAQVKEETGYDAYTTPMLIYTTMDREKQDYVNNIMNGTNFSWVTDKVNAGITAIDVKTGALVAVGAGRNFTAKGFNTATDIKKQIGSTAKPVYDYGPAIEYLNWSTYSPIVDEPYTYSDGTKIKNWDNGFIGFATARTSLAQSRNISALKVFQANKNANIYEFVTNLGLHPEVSNGSTFVHEAHAIGGYNGEAPISMAAAYEAFANGGYYVEPYSYTKLVFRETGKAIETEINKTRAMSEETAYMVYDMLSSTAKVALGSQSYINGANYGAKTGTTNFDEPTRAALNLPSSAINDFWVTGTSPDYAISVWYGYNENTRETSALGYYNVYGTVYHRLLFQAVAKGFFKAGSYLTKPNGVVSVVIENDTYPAQLPSAYTPTEFLAEELFKAGTEPTEVSTRFSQLKNVTNLKSTVKDSKVTLSWTKITDPEAIDKDKITTLFKTLYTDPSTLTAAIDARVNWNNSYFGDIEYLIYSKNSNDDLTLIGKTNDSSYTFNVTSASPTSYVVKTSYTNFSANMSSGQSIKITLSDVDNVTISLVGNASKIITTGSYTEEGVKVTNNSKDVTSSSTVSITYTNSSGKIVKVTDITSAKPDTYTVKYVVKYNTTEKTLTRTVTTTN